MELPENITAEYESLIMDVKRELLEAYPDLPPNGLVIGYQLDPNTEVEVGFYFVSSEKENIVKHTYLFMLQSETTVLKELEGDDLKRFQSVYASESAK